MVSDEKLFFICTEQDCNGKVKIVSKRLQQPDVLIKVIMVIQSHDKTCRNKLDMQKVHIGQVRDLYHVLLTKGQIIPINIEAVHENEAPDYETRFRYLQEYRKNVEDGKKETALNDKKPIPQKD